MNRSAAPAVKQLSDIFITEPEIYHLSNGIKVVQFNAGTQELVRIELIFRAGSWQQSRNFVALATNLMLREGTSKHTSGEISEILDFYGAHLEAAAEKDNAYLSLYSLNKHLNHTLPILEELVKYAAFPEKEFSILAGKQRQMLQVNLEKVNFIARSRFNSLLFGKSHAYGNYLGIEDIGLVERDDLAEFYRDHYQAGTCTIMVAGKTSPDLPKMLEDAFGGNGWHSHPAVEPVYQLEAVEERRHFIHKPGALQSAIRMGRIMFNKHHPDYIGMKILNTLAGGYFGSRLMTNLREDKGYTYGIGSAVIPLLHSGYFFISCEVGSEVTTPAIREIESELQRLIDHPVDAGELDLVRNYMLGAFLRGIDGPFALADTYREVMEEGLDNRFYLQLIESVRSITAEELRDLAARYLDPASMHLLVVGNSEPA